MKKLILILVTIAATAVFAQPSPTQLNIDPDKIIKTTDIMSINQACIKKHLNEVFKTLTGEVCTPMTTQDLSELVQRNIYYQTNSVYLTMPDRTGLAEACKRSILSKKNGDVNSIVFMEGSDGSLTTPYRAYIHRYDSSVNNNYPLLQNKIVLLVAEIYKFKVPYLSINTGATVRTKYDQLGEIAFTYYVGSDLIITAPTNVTYFWQNNSTGKEVEILPIPRAEFISCIEDELAKLP